MEVFRWRGTDFVRPDPRQVLSVADYDRAWRVIEECSTAGSLAELRETLMEALARHFGYTDGWILAAPSLADLARDPEPLFTGRVELLREPYLEEFHRTDPLSVFVRTCDPNDRFPRSITLDEVHHFVARESERYLASFLRLPSGRVRSLLGFEFSAGGLFVGLALHAEESGAFGARDLAVTRLMSGTLSRLLSRLVAAPGEPAWLDMLNRRQAEAARLIALGHSNEEVARRMMVGVPTVKKYVTAVLSVSGCRSRAELAARWPRG